MVTNPKKMSRPHSDRTWVLKTDSILYNSIAVAFRVMQVYGMYPVNNLPKWLYYCYAAFVHCTLTLPVPLLVFAYMFVNRKTLDLVTVIDLLFMVMEMAITIPKYTPIRARPERVRRTVEWLTRKEFTTYHPDQEKIAVETSELFKTVYFYYRRACILTLLILVFKPILMGQFTTLPTVIWLPFDPAQNYYIFVPVYLLVSLGTTNSGMGNSSLDCMIVGLIYHATAQLRIIKGALRDVIRHAEERVSNEHGRLPPTEFNELKNQYVYEEICKCVDRYNLVKEFTKDIEDTYSLSIFAQFTASIVIIGLAGIQFFLVEMWTVPFYLIVVWISIMTTEVFIFCYFGSLLYFESLTFVTDLYLSDWLELDAKSQKAYLIIMENAKKPLMIRAGKIIDLSLDTFGMIMRRSYSLLAVCNKLL